MVQIFCRFKDNQWCIRSIPYIWACMFSLAGIFMVFGKNDDSVVGNDSIVTLIPVVSPQHSLNDITHRWYKLSMFPQYLLNLSTDTGFQVMKGLFSPTDTSKISQITTIEIDKFPITRIYWRVRGYISNEIETPWSQTGSYVVLHDKLPIIPPFEKYIHTQTPTLRWHRPPKESNRCELKIHTDSLSLFKGSTTLFTILIPSGDTTYTFTNQTPLPVGTVYWKLEYPSKDPQFPLCTPINSFTIVSNQIPIPIDFTLTNKNKPVFYWKKTTNSAAYTIEIAADQHFLNPLILTPVYDTFYISTKNLEYSNQPYYWRVCSNGYDMWSTTHSFYIKRVPLLHTFNGGIHSGTKPTLRWVKIKDKQKYTYAVQISEIRDFKYVTVDASNLGDTNQYTLPLSLETDRVWYWRVGYKVPEIETFNYTDYDSLQVTTAVNKIIIPHKTHNNGHALMKATQKRVTFTSSSRKISFLYARVYDLKGKTVQLIRPIGGNKNVLTWDYSGENGAPIPPGMYFFHVVSTNRNFLYSLLFYD